MQQVFGSQPREQGVHGAIVVEADVVESAHVDPGAKVLPTDVGIDDRRPRHGQRIHTVLVLEVIIL